MESCWDGMSCADVSTPALTGRSYVQYSKVLLGPTLGWIVIDQGDMLREHAARPRFR